MPRFSIIKGNEFDDHYMIVDGETQSVVAWADGLRDAQKVLSDIEKIVWEDKVIDEAMNKLGL